MVDVRKSRMKVLGQEQLISKEISFHAPIKRNRKILLTEKDGNVKVEEVNANILEILNSYILKNRETCRFQRSTALCSFPVHLSISNPDECRPDTAKSKLDDILLQYLENNTYNVS